MNLVKRLFAKVKDAFSHKEGKTILKLGSNIQNSGLNKPMVVMKPLSNRWTRFKRLVTFPFKYIWYGRAEL